VLDPDRIDDGSDGDRKIQDRRVSAENRVPGASGNGSGSSRFQSEEVARGRTEICRNCGALPNNIGGGRSAVLGRCEPIPAHARSVCLEAYRGAIGAELPGEYLDRESFSMALRRRPDYWNTPSRKRISICVR